MKIWFLALLLLVLPFTLALDYAKDAHTAIAEGYANLQIENKPPVVEEVQLTPTTIYKDGTLECLTKVQDEQLPSVNLHYAWKINNQAVPETGYKLSGFKENDEITCTVYAEDNAHQLSNTKSLLITVSPAPWHAKALSTVLSGIGIPTDITHALRLEEQGAPAVTGYVIDESEKNGTGILFLVFIGLVFLTLLNVSLVLRHYVRKQEKTA